MRSGKRNNLQSHLFLAARQAPEATVPPLRRLWDVGDRLANNEGKEDGDEAGLDKVGAEPIEVPAEDLRLGRLLLHSGIVPVRIPRALYLLSRAVDISRSRYHLPYGRRPVMRRRSHLSQRGRPETLFSFSGQGGTNRKMGYGDGETESNKLERAVERERVCVCKVVREREEGN